MDFFGRSRNAARRSGISGRTPMARATVSANLAGCAVASTIPCVSGLILFREALPAQHPDGGVGIEHVAVALLHIVHDAQGFLVAEAASPDVAADGLKIVVVEIDDAREVARVPDVHRIGNRVARGARNQLAAAKEFRHDVVGVGRRDELRNTQADALGQQPAGQDCRNCRWGPKTREGIPTARVARRRRSNKKFAGSAAQC